MSITPRTPKSWLTNAISCFALDANDPSLHELDVEYHGVRITPPVMVFKKAFEGRQYRQKLIVQNVGERRIFVRICPTTSYAFEFKPLIRGCYLSPGLTIVRIIKYTYMKATAMPIAVLPIYINGNRIEYRLVVSLSTPIISAEPQEIKFDTIDEGHAANIRTLLLKNSGSRATRFFIDLGRNEIGLSVEPSKGIIQPNSSITLRVECMGVVLGEFTRDFWIKCDSPQRIIVTGTVIPQCFKAIHHNATQSFTLVDFPRIYFGTSCVKCLAVKNYSSMSAGYCIVASMMDEIISIEEAIKRDPEYANFTFRPQEGFLLPQEAGIFQITYKSPKIPLQKRNENVTKQSFCSFRIVRIPCRTVDQVEDLEDEEEQERKLSGVPIESNSSSRLHSREELAGFKELEHEIVLPTSAVSPNNIVKVALFAQAESAGISIRPDALDLQDIAQNKPTTRELNLTNKSQELPISFEYRKVAYVEVEPKKGFLRPSESVEVLVTITPAKLGPVATKITFDLLFYDRLKKKNVVVGGGDIPLKFSVLVTSSRPKPVFSQGITPKYIKDVGYAVDDVRFNSNLDVPRSTLLKTVKTSKEDHDLIAFPNDRPQSLRPWRNPIRCRTICAGITRGVDLAPDEYQLTKSELEMKQNEYSYYKNYLQQEAEQLRRLRKCSKLPLPEYDVYDSMLKLSTTPKCIVPPKELKKLHHYIPLTPLQLNKIHMRPFNILLGKLGAGTTVAKKIAIYNHNEFPIMVMAKSRNKKALTFPDGFHVEVKGLSANSMLVEYQAPTLVGRYSTCVEFIVNWAHSYAVPVVGDVVPSVVRITTKEIEFVSNQKSSEYFNVYNNLNVPLAYQWNVPHSCFKFEPLQATIPPNSYIITQVSYVPHHYLPTSAEVTIRSECGRKQNLHVSTKLAAPKVAFKNYKLFFEDLPLNIKQYKKALLRNTGDETVSFMVTNPEPLPGIAIYPTEGIIRGNEEIPIDIIIMIPVCVSFQCSVEFQLQSFKNIKLAIAGSVAYPLLEIRPELMHFRKIVTNAFERQVFVLHNKSPAEVTVEFQLHDFPEYTVLETRDYTEWEDKLTKVKLHKGEEKELYLHYHPIGATAFRTSIPFVINDILGPAFIRKPETQESIFFLQNQLSVYENLKGVKGLPVPEKVPMLVVACVVGMSLVRFSKEHFHFRYFPHKGTYESHHRLKVWNETQNLQKCCIRTDELTAPFSIMHINGKRIEKLKYSIVCTLKPKEETILEIAFFPATFGSYHIKLPIYIRDYLDGCLFNYLCLRGSFPGPEMKPLEKIIYLIPLPLNCENEYSSVLQHMRHPPTCQISAKVDIPDMEVQLTQKNEIAYEDGKVVNQHFLIKCCFEEPGVYEGRIRFFCTCNVECSVSVKTCADNCIFTTHAFLHDYSKSTVLPYMSSQHSVIADNEDIMSSDYSIYEPPFANKCEQNSYPLFPVNDGSDYAQYMEKALTAVEEWLYDQIFFKRNYCQVPEGIATPPEVTKEKEDKASDKKKSKKKNFPVLKIVEVLTALVGPQIEKCLPLKPLPYEELPRINYIFNLYVHIKDFIQIQGGILPTVFPEYLLTYDDYVKFLEQVYPHRADYNDGTVYETTAMSCASFWANSKQNWLDLLLQIYKVFVEARVENTTKRPSVSVMEKLNSWPLSGSYYQSCTTMQYSLAVASQTSAVRELKVEVVDPKLANMFNEHEFVLIGWLEKAYRDQANRIWSSAVTERKIEYLNVDLSDSMFLIAVTIQSCPYLEPFFNSVYVHASSFEQAFHNAALLVQAWNNIGLSFSITPSDIVSPNLVKMIMLVNYLYEILPSFYPQQSISIKTGLSTKCTENIPIENSTNFPIAYTVIFFRNEQELFSVDKPLINFRPRQKTDIKLTYYARKIYPSDVIMIFNGETPKRNYAKTIVFNVVGEPNLGHASEETTIQAPIYIPSEVTLSVTSPYKGAYSYSISFALSDPSEKNVTILSWEEERHRQIPKRVVSWNSTLDVNEEGEGTLHIFFFCMTMLVKPYWIFFRNEDAGDFCIKAISIALPEPKLYHELTVILPSSFHRLPCLCKETTEASRHCPRNIMIQIPRRNLYLWRVVEASMMKVVDENDLVFWRRYLGTTAGIYIKKWMSAKPNSKTSFEIQELFDDTVTYNIITDASRDVVILPSSTTICGVHSFDFHEISIHIGRRPANFCFTLEALHGREVRHFQLHFQNEMCVETSTSELFSKQSPILDVFLSLSLKEQ